MEEMPILFPVTPKEFWKQLRSIVEEVVEAKMNAGHSIPAELSEKTLLKPLEVCDIFRVSKATLYEWMRQGRLKSFKIRSRRYFARTDIEAIIKRQQRYAAPTV
ncbi:MAG: helix-turn-helix domain-containing protein [Chitinophagaceae bacterium]|nr:MAG: helix-turn-helix domain-containing protein [Chitinophagaceae bacterium]